MKLPILNIFLFLTTTVAVSQTEQNGNQNFQIIFKSITGKEISIEVLDNTKWSIPTAIVLLGDKTTLEKELQDCDSWKQLQNRTYIIDKEISNTKDLQEAIDYILSNQKLLDSDLYLFQLHDEFELIETKSGNIKGGKIIQRIDGELCKTMIK